MGRCVEAVFGLRRMGILLGMRRHIRCCLLVRQSLFVFQARLVLVRLLERLMGFCSTMLRSCTHQTVLRQLQGHTRSPR